MNTALDRLRRAPRAAAAALLGSLVLGGCLSWHQGPMPGEPAAATYAVIDGVRVRYEDAGTAQGDQPPVVLLHGFASALETWATVAPRLRQHRRVIALDLKGFGWTDRPAGDYSPMAQGKLLLGLLRQLGVERFDLVAHSWGSSVALATALQAPSQVRRIALYDAWVFDEQLPAFFRWAKVPGVGELLFGGYYKERGDERLVRAFFDPSAISEAFIEEVERALERPGTVAAALAAVRGQNFDLLEQQYPTIRQPVLLLWGRDDIVTWPLFGERLARTLPNARLEIFDRCGHFPMLEAALPSYRLLAEFLGVQP